MAGMAGMAGQFLSSCDSKYFRDRIVAQLAGAKESHFPDPNSGDPMEQFIAQNSPEQLEEFIFKNSKGNREEYLSLTAEMLLAVRQCRGSPGQGREHLAAADSPEASSEPQQQTSTDASTDEEAAKAD